MKKVLFLLILLNIGLSLQVFSQNSPGSITVNTSYNIGSRWNSGMEACNYAGFYIVSVSGINGSQNGTDSKFTFYNINPGTYTVSVSMSCKFQDNNSCKNCKMENTKYRQATVTVKDGQNVSVNITFSASSF